MLNHKILWRATIWMALIFFGFAQGPSCLAQAPTAQVFRVLSFNIHHGEGLDGKLDLKRIARVIKEERADLVALQEVDRGAERTQKRDVAAELAALTGMKFEFGKNLDFQGGAYGNAILSRFPLSELTNTLLKMVRAGELRGVLQARVALGGRSLVFMATHLDHRAPDEDRVSSVQQIKTLAAALPETEPLIVAGDFNDIPGSSMHRGMMEQFADTWELVGQGPGPTIPVGKPNRRIDYIWFTPGRGLEPVKATVPTTDASDHLPVATEFRLESERRK